MLERDRWVVHLDVAASVDLLLRGRQPSPEIRSVAADGSVVISRPEPPSQRSEVKSVPQRPSWRESGQMLPVVDANKEPLRANFAQLLEATLDAPTVGRMAKNSPSTSFPMPSAAII